MWITRYSIRVFTCLALFAALHVSSHAQGKQRLTAAQIFRDGEPKLIVPLPTIVGWADDDHYLESKKNGGDDRQKVYAVSVVDGSEKLYRDLGQYADLVGKEISAANPTDHDEEYSHLLYVKGADLYLLDTRRRKFKRLTDNPDEKMNPTVSPDGSAVAFTRNNNLFSIDVASGKETQYTRDGGEEIYNGWASWVYYEEILGRASRHKAFWWSPDSKRILFYRFDDSSVPKFPIFRADGKRGSLEYQHYPKVGDPNPRVRVGVVTAGKDGKVVWGDFDELRDQYFGVPFWTPDGKEVFVQWMNRGQDTLTIFALNPTDGTKRIVYTEHQASWVDWLESMQFLKKSSAFMVQSDRDGWNHLYVYGMDGTLRNRVTGGNWAVTGVELVNEDAGVVYFTAKKEASTRTDLYKVQLDGKGLKRLTSGEFTHAVNVSPTGKHFTSRYSAISTPTRLALYTGEGNIVREVADSKSAEFDKYAIAPAELFRVRTSDGYDLPVSWMLPTDFDPGKRYPVLITVYGGPASGTVSNSWSGLRSQWLAMEGVIQVSLDHRGSGHFGKAGTALMHRNLGKWEMIDYIECVKWLRAKPFVDTTKVCITGGSYGGYVTCMALTYGADYFTHGVAVLSVTDWELYDSHYTERFMDTKEENPEGYAFSSVMTHVPKYKGMLLIVHGTMDDNVHMQNSIQLIDRLEDQRKIFEMMFYPGGRHGWGGPKAQHLRELEYRFYYRYLLEKEYPAEGLGRMDGRSRRE